MGQWEHQTTDGHKCGGVSMNQGRIIALSGPRACGKSTIASHLVSQHGYTRIAFADALRELASVAGYEFSNDRIYLAQLGEKLRALMPEFLLEVVRKKVNSLEGPVVIEDLRFPSEVNFCRSIGATTIRLEISEEIQLQRVEEREGKVGKEAAELLACLDESLLDEIQWDSVIDAVGDFKKLALKLHSFNSKDEVGPGNERLFPSDDAHNEVRA